MATVAEAGLVAVERVTLEAADARKVSKRADFDRKMKQIEGLLVETADASKRRK